MPRKLTSAIRADKLKRIHEAALRQGWTSSINGSGHVVMVGPNGGRFIISKTANDGAGRRYENTKAEARRAGLDVSKL